MVRGSLQQTRIGRTVNELRKRTENRELAHRARSLVRGWQLLLPSGGGQAAVNGDGVRGVSGVPARLQGGGSRPSSPASRPGTPASLKSCWSPALAPPAAAACRAAMASRLSPAGTSPAARLGSPANRSVGRHSSPGYAPRLAGGTPAAEGGKRASPVTSTPVGQTGARYGVGGCGVAYSPAASAPPAWGKHLSPVNSTPAGRHSSPAYTPRPSTPQAGGEAGGRTPGVVRPPTAERVGPTLSTAASSASLTVTHAASKKRRSELGACAAGPPSKRLADGQHKVANGLVAPLPRPTSNGRGDRGKLDRMGSGASLGGGGVKKVKTTAQLIQGMHASGVLRLTRSETVTKIALNQIEKEADVDPSVVPPEAKPRPRRKPGSLLPAASTQSMSQTKTELVQKFLQTSCPPAEFDLSLLPPSYGTPVSPSPPPVKWDVSSAAASVVDDVDVLPPLNLDDIVWSDDDDVPFVERPPVCDADVDRLHDEHWPGVNGQTDVNGDWTDWTQCMSRPTHDGQMLHILPYVEVDVDDYKLPADT